MKGEKWCSLQRINEAMLLGWCHLHISREQFVFTIEAPTLCVVGVHGWHNDSTMLVRGAFDV